MTSVSEMSADVDTRHSETSEVNSDSVRMEVDNESKNAPEDKTDVTSDVQPPSMESVVSKIIDVIYPLFQSLGSLLGPYVEMKSSFGNHDPYSYHKCMAIKFKLTLILSCQLLCHLQ